MRERQNRGGAWSSSRGGGAPWGDPSGGWAARARESCQSQPVGLIRQAFRQALRQAFLLAPPIPKAFISHIICHRPNGLPFLRSCQEEKSRSIGGGGSRG